MSSLRVAAGRNFPGADPDSSSPHLRSSKFFDQLARGCVIIIVTRDNYSFVSIFDIFKCDSFHNGYLQIKIRVKKKKYALALLQKCYLVSARNTFFVAASVPDTNHTIQKIKHILCRLEWTDTKNQFSKKNP
jgi:hypothetical protein